jgi:glycosyltransferase involved in cell wall biosynthesis
MGVSRPRIVINASFLAQPDTGSGQYITRLLQSLAKADHENDYILIAPRPKFRVQSSKLSVSGIQYPLVSNIEKLWFEQVAFPRACRRERADLAHVPYFGSPLFPSVPTVVTVHDLIPMILPAYGGSLLVRAYTSLVVAAAKRARLVIADSECSKRDIVQWLGIPPSRVRVIYLAADAMFRPVEDGKRLDAVRRRYGLPNRFVLYLGGFDVRKNVAAIVAAFARVRKSLPHHRLVLAGKLPQRDTAFFPDPRRLADEAGLGGEVCFIGWVAEEDKPVLYSLADLFVFPSCYEGFGLPVLEALACGTPIVASNAGSLPEIVGEAGLMVAPDDIDGLAKAMIAVLGNEARRAELRAKGLEQARRFSWEKTAQETMAVYREIV